MPLVSALAAELGASVDPAVGLVVLDLAVWDLGVFVPVEVLVVFDLAVDLVVFELAEDLVVFVLVVDLVVFVLVVDLGVVDLAVDLGVLVLEAFVPVEDLVVFVLAEVLVAFDLVVDLVVLVLAEVLAASVPAVEPGVAVLVVDLVVLVPVEELVVLVLLAQLVVVVAVLAVRSLDLAFAAAGLFQLRLLGGLRPVPSLHPTCSLHSPEPSLLLLLRLPCLDHQVAFQQEQRFCSQLLVEEQTRRSRRSPLRTDPASDIRLPPVSLHNTDPPLDCRRTRCTILPRLRTRTRHSRRDVSGNSGLFRALPSLSLTSSKFQWKQLPLLSSQCLPLQKKLHLLQLESSNH